MAFSWHTFARVAMQITSTVIPIVNPALTPMVGVIGHAIAEAEAIPGASGAEKTAHVQKIVNDAVSATNTAAGKEIINVASVNEALQEGIDTVVAATNAVVKR